ncbi:MAG: hypothetical protein FWD01_02615, partial [Defluviitaleaceae bacterium]|nr:hypothetical protein [Defluviitaleaceae bacterium]
VLGGSEVAAFNHLFTEFHAATGGRNYELRPIADNRVYYVRIVARRDPQITSVSEPAYGSYFFPPVGPIGTRPPIMARPPLRIVREELDALTMQWKTQWFEAYDSTQNEWHSEIGVTTTNQIVFGDAITQAIRDANRVLDLSDYTTATAARTAIRALGVSVANSDELRLPLRSLDLRDAGYEIYVAAYNSVSDQIDNLGYNRFVETVLSQANWVGIEPEAVTVGGRSARQFRITEAQLPAGNLQQNTTYAIFFRPYTIHLPTGQREAWWPTIVTGTTTDERPEIPVTPTVPVLEPHESGDTWLTVRFRYSAALEYELRFSELLSDVPGGGRLIQNEELMAEGWAGTGEHSAYWFFTIPNLFPDTMHYIWMRSIGTSTTSDWSNPIAMSTLQLTAPIPPEALGLASQNNLNIINLENDLELIPVDSDYMIIEWLRNSNDLREPMGNEDVDGGQILGSPNIHHAYIVQFTDLIANRAHYVRARTVHMVSRSGVGGDVTRSYSYIVELSPNADFTDSVTIYVPSDETEFEENANRRVRISDWTQTFVFFTIRDDGEYDGDVRAELFPLPGHDFEIIYDRLTSTLTYRFRSDRTDASGNRDNLVDQRFISRLIQNRTFDFEIDLSTFDRNLVQNRVVEIPYSVISAFTERQISLSIQAGNTGYSFAPGFADSQEINAAGFGRDSRLRLEILQDNLNLPALQQNQRFISSPQRLDVNLVAPSASLRSTPINNLGAPVEISHRISAVDSMDRNIGAYRIGGDFSYWTRVDNDNFDQRTGMLSHSTTRLGNFAPIGVAAPVLTYGTDTATTNALMFVNSVMQIDGLVSLNPQDNINAWQANKLIAAAARGDNSVNVNDDLTEQELNSLTSARMLVPGDMTVSREDALAALVRLYEVRSGFPVLGHGDITSSGFADIGLASPNLQTAILKAEHLGFLGSSGLANPRGDLNFGDFIKIMEIILRNS